MPTYEYHCDSCGNNFAMRRGMTDNERDTPCPECKGTVVARQYSSFYARTAKKS